jgi:pimeloyl-ACP methyl ester carboxylesterase
VQLYRTFLLREAVRGARGRLRVPARLVVGARDPVVRPSLLAGRERFADDLTIELVPDCGHWIPAERPDLVAERVLSPI